MPRTIRFHLDEHCANAVAHGLRRRGIDVTTTDEADLSGAADEEQVAYCLREARVIFTQDRDFLRLNAQGVEHSGIVYCDQDSRSIGRMIAGLIKVWEQLEPDVMRGRVQFI